jgi:hypothetical protein
MRTLRKLLAAVAFAGVALHCPADDKPKDAPADAKPIVVPMEILPSRHFVVPVTLNGKGPFRMILDTGAPLTLINSKAGKAGALTKKESGGGLLGMLGGGLNQVTVAKLKVGEVECEKVPAVVMDHPTVKAISDAFEDEGGPIYGLVGFPFFGRYAMTVDYQKKELTFRPNGYKPGDYLQDLMTNLMNADKMNKPKTLTAAGLWGFAVDKGKSDEAAGVTVKTVYAGGPADKAGLKAGDRLLTVDGRWTDSVGDTAVAVNAVKPGKSVTAVVARDGKEVKLTVTPTAGQ